MIKKLIRTNLFIKDYNVLPAKIQSRVEQKLSIFIQNPHHPSLRIKKMQGHKNIWEGSISMRYRFTFEIREDTYILRRIGAHDMLYTP